jgi:hypothetical protein
MTSSWRGSESWGEPTGPSRTSSTATLALIAGIASFVCLFGFGGILAIALGWVAHSDIERSQGRLTGKALASTGIGLGIANLVFSVVGVAALIALAVRPDPLPASGPRPLPPSHPTFPAPGLAPTPSPSPGPSPSIVPPQAQLEPQLPSLPPRVGKIAVVEASVGAEGLESQLRKQVAETAKSGEHVVLWTVVPDCEPCAAVGRALGDPRMQRALANVRLVRADVMSFARELQNLGVPVDETPGFALVDAQGRALDYIHGGEWDADIPANIAPILGKFVRRDLKPRRHPWARPLREGETPL